MVFTLHGIEWGPKIYMPSGALCLCLLQPAGFGVIKAQSGMQSERMVLFDAEICHSIAAWLLV